MFMAVGVNGPIVALAIGPGDRIYYASDGKKIWMGNSDVGIGWAEADPSSQLSGLIRAISVDPSSSLVVYVGANGGRVWVGSFTFFGPLWTQISGDLPNLPLNAITVYRNSTVSHDPMIFVGLNHGVFFTIHQLGASGAKTHWLQYGKLPESDVEDLTLGSENIIGVGSLSNILVALNI